MGECMSPPLFGRSVIRSPVGRVTAENILDVLTQARYEHQKNRNEISYLWDYYRGEQPILSRVKEIRPEINNRVVENRANEIVSFKVGYLVGKPIQYVGQNNKKKTITEITRLNTMMSAEKKSYHDRRVAEWGAICGTAYRLVLPKRPRYDGDAPFKIRTLDPRDTMVVYSSSVDEEPLLGAKFGVDAENVEIITAYTPELVFTVRDGEIAEISENVLGTIPIIEYPANHARLGAFETVLPILDAINNIDSNRMDGVEQFVQAFVKFINCDISEEEFRDLMALGGLKLKSVDGLPADADIVSSELNQTQTQTLKDDLYNSVLTIVGMPNRNGGSSTSDTGQAVYMRDGYAAAETSAESTENMFRASESEMLEICLRICAEDGILNLTPTQVDVKFTRRNYDAIQSKAQVLVSMLSSEKIHPLLAFTHCGLFSDPEGAYALSEEYAKSMADKETEAQKSAAQGSASTNADGENNTETKQKNNGEGTPKNA